MKSLFTNGLLLPRRVIANPLHISPGNQKTYGIRSTIHQADVKKTDSLQQWNAMASERYIEAHINLMVQVEKSEFRSELHNVMQT